jgi:RNA polymerase sigma-70 factor (ECF subfamily)
VKTSAPRRFPLPVATSGGPAAARSTAAGHADQFKQVVLPHLDGAYNLARYLTRDAVLSEDLVQDAVLRAFRAFDQFRGGSPRAWLFAIVRNCCRTALSSGGGVVSLVHDEEAARLHEQPDPAPTPEEETFRKADVARVRAAVEAIPEPFREAVVLRDLEGLSYAEIAEVTDVPVGTVMSRLSRGRAMLAAELLPTRAHDIDQSRSVK